MTNGSEGLAGPAGGQKALATVLIPVVDAILPHSVPRATVRICVEKEDGTGGLRRNMRSHRHPQVHLIVHSMESTGVYWIPFFRSWSARGLQVFLATHTT